MAERTKNADEKYKPYIEGLVAREKQRRQRRRQRAAEAMEVARQAAQLLRARYNVRRIRVFGSVLHPDHFHERSDIDLAVEGLSPQDFLKAWGMLNGGSPEINSDFEIDLVTPEECRAAIWDSVQREGVDV